MNKYYRYEVIQYDDKPSDIIPIQISREEYKEMENKRLMKGGMR